MKKITFKQAIDDMQEYLNNTDFDYEYIEVIYEYLLNTKIKIVDNLN